MTRDMMARQFENVHLWHFGRDGAGRHGPSPESVSC